jgi:hypothetical protein
MKMKENKILEEEIDRYLDGSMTEEERETFNSRLEKDSELYKEVELQRSIIKAVRREQLGRIIQKEEGRINKRRKDRKLVIYFGSLAVAASVLGIFYIGNLNNCENIANRYYVSYVYTPIPSRGGENLHMTKSDSIFFNALHQLENGNKKLAIRQLENLNNSTTEMIAASAQTVKWYLALACLKNGEKKKAKVLLQEIENMPNGEFTLKAKDLLKELK